MKEENFNYYLTGVAEHSLHIYFRRNHIRVLLILNNFELASFIREMLGFGKLLKHGRKYHLWISDYFGCFTFLSRISESNISKKELIWKAMDYLENHYPKKIHKWKRKRSKRFNPLSIFQTDYCCKNK